MVSREDMLGERERKLEGVDGTEEEPARLVLVPRKEEVG